MRGRAPRGLALRRGLGKEDGAAAAEGFGVELVVGDERQGWSVPRIRFCSSDNAFRPFPISRVIQILQLASLREPLCANGRHSEQVPSALPKSHNSARACKRAKTRLAFQRPEGK